LANEAQLQQSASFPFSPAKKRDANVGGCFYCASKKPLLFAKPQLFQAAYLFYLGRFNIDLL
jgi:hypothetical protein